MSSFLSSAQKQQFESVMQRMHETFSRTIFAYKDAKKIIVSMDPKFQLSL